METLGRIANVAGGGPAATACLRRGNIAASLGGVQVNDAVDFYRRLWSMGEAGVEIRLQVERSTVMRDVTVKSGDRYKYLRLDSSL